MGDDPRKWTDEQIAAWVSENAPPAEINRLPPLVRLEPEHQAAAAEADAGRIAMA